MKNTEQINFLNLVTEALKTGAFKRVVFSGLIDASNNDSDEVHKFKKNYELIEGGRKQFIKYSDTQIGQEQTFELDVESLQSTFMSADFPSFKAATLCTELRDWLYSENRKGEPRLAKAKASMKGVVQTHNKPKNYVLDEKRPYLKGLGVTNANGVVVKKHYAKFRQIANFVEIIDRDISEFVEQSDAPISILDLGCGKGYLTFATYDYVKQRAKIEPKGVGIDIKANVIELCNDLSASIGFDGLEFKNLRIEPTKPEKVDILIALHACNTATDDALALGLRSNMEYLFCAPCCQAELAAQMRSGTVENTPAFATLNSYPLIQRRQADLITDVCRALLLTALGYEVKFLEFTALEHTAKNIMLAGKKSASVDRKKAYDEYLDLKKSYGFERHSLEENVKDLLAKL